MRTNIGILFAALTAGCAGPGSAGPSAEAQVAPLGNHAVKGKVTFAQQGDAVRVVAQLAGLPPGGHGFHIHEKGDCSAPDGMSAGGHFNPTGKPHGDPAKGEHHVGDMPMLDADAQGNARLSADLKGVSLRDGPNAIVGRSVIVHVSPDDYKTQPTGNSGGRMGCGVIAIPPGAR